MIMRIDLKGFIEKYKDEINHRLFKKIYSLATTGELDYSDISKLTELFYKCGIDPLQYMAEVPSFYAYGSTLKDVKIPDKITYIGDKAFAFCRNLASVVIPDSVNSIYYQAFYNCTELTSIIIPDSVTSIGNEVFYNCRELTSVTLGNSVTSIGIGAFRFCTGLTSITIPNSVTLIGDQVFWRSRSLKTINYLGSKKQWDSISKGTDWNGYTSIKVIHCVDGDITLIR